MTTFKELGLSQEIMAGLEDLGFLEPSPIQARAIPFLLKSKKDLTALAQTGTGKTAAFGLPILNQIKPGSSNLEAIILCPTRELCLQISGDIKKFAKYLKAVSITPVYGGARIDLQINSLRRGTNIVVGTPGRVHDLIRRKVLKLQNIKWLVLDEADEMLDMGFKDDLDAILTETPASRQTLLFSATMSKSVHLIAKKYMKDAEEISVGEKNVGAEKISHEYYIVGARDRFEALKRILDSLPGIYGILFCRTKYETQEVADKLKQAGYDAEAMHGDISQNIRTKIMDRFKRKQIKLLVATDVAARGIDVSDLSHVINYNLPDNNEAYTHRSGRTGRAQKSGISISITTPREASRIKGIERMISKNFECKKLPNGEDVCRKQIDNFIDEIEGANIDDIGNEKYFADIMERFKKHKKEDLIKYFIAYKFNNLINEHKNVRDLNVDIKRDYAKADSGNYSNLKINIGKKQDFDVKSFFSLINSSRDLKGVDVGRISLMQQYTVFSVDKNRADDVIDKLSKMNWKGRKIEAAKSNEEPNYPRKRQNRSNRRFESGRNNFRRRKY